MDSKKHYKGWNIKDISESVIRELKEDEIDEEEIDNTIDYYLQRAYWSIYSREAVMPE